MLNVTAVGHLTKDPEQRQVNSDLSVTNFKILVNKKIKGEDFVSAINCTIWGNMGNTAMVYLKKGDQVTVSGSALLRAYSRQNGEPGAEIELKVSEFVLPPKPKEANWQSSPRVPQTDQLPF